MQAVTLVSGVNRNEVRVSLSGTTVNVVARVNGQPCQDSHTFPDEWSAAVAFERAERAARVDVQGVH